MATLTITGDQGYTRVDVAGASWDVIDCSAATFHLKTDGSPQQDYPFRIRNNTVQVDIIDGTCLGSINETVEWGSLYNPIGGNSAMMFCEDLPSGTRVSGWFITKTWDAIRMIRTPNYVIENCHILDCRDDGVEADWGDVGTIRNSLFEGCFSGLSFGSDGTPSSSFNNVVTIDNVLIGMKNWPRNYAGQTMTHSHPLKGQVDKSPRLKMTNCAIAIANVIHDGMGRWTYMMENRIHPDSADNWFLNLTDNALPGNYPTLHSSFTHLSGQAARDKWEDLRDAFLNGEPPPDPEPEPGEPGLFWVAGINEATKVIFMETNYGEWTGEVTVGMTNSEDSDTEPVTLTVAD